MSCDKFPKWKPQYGTLMRMDSADRTVRYYTLLKSSSSFVQRKDVREVILKKCNYKCVECGRTERLCIDHIKSIYSASLGKISTEYLNSYDNLQVLCIHCNSRKAP